MSSMRMIVVFLLYVTFCSAFTASVLLDDADDSAFGFCADRTPPIDSDSFSLVVEQEVPQLSSDPYKGWKRWCEPVVYDIPCKKNDDCAGVYPNHPAQRPMKCINPWYAKEHPEIKVCAPGYARNAEVEWRGERLREIVRQQYFKEVDECELDGRPISKEGWKCQMAARGGDKLTNFLLIPYDRETMRMPFKRHRLDADLRANVTAWFKQAQTYGWAPVTDGGEFIKMEKVGDDSSPYYGERHRWHYGLGPFGQNASLWVHNWDPQAPPEILCKEVEAVETYLRKMRDTVVKLRNGIRCSGGFHENKSPTWEVLHRATSSGKICPSTGNSERAERKSKRFRASAAGHAINPDEVVTLKMLGTPIPKSIQNARSSEIYSAVDKKWPIEKMSKKH